MFPPLPPNMFPQGGGYAFSPYTPNAFPPWGGYAFPHPSPNAFPHGGGNAFPLGTPCARRRRPQCVPPAAPSGKEEGKPPAPVPHMHAQRGQAAPRGAIFRPASPSDGK